MGVKCFMVYPTGRFKVNMRRYASSTEERSKCIGREGYGYHNADGPVLDTIEGSSSEHGGWHLEYPEVPFSDPRWPKRCDHCNYQFSNDDQFQLFADQIYLDVRGTEYSLRKPIPGMMWYADWMGDWAKGPDGNSLCVVCPDGHQWMIDGRASNCTMPKDSGPFESAHRCWVRHGIPPNITVDKNGRTCKAGGGSIQTPKYHGFLRNGEFT